MKTELIEKHNVSPGSAGKTRKWKIGTSTRSILFGLIGMLPLGFANHATAAGVQIAGSLANFDVRYPPALPNDLEIYLYGAGLTTADVLSTFNNPQWGPANSITASVNNDPTSPGFGLNCITVRWAGPPLPALVGQMRHFGVRLKIGAAVAHQEIWWTINGQRILRPCDPKVTWICSRNVWLICVENPTPSPMYIYGCRWFPVPTTVPLPQLHQLNTNINPIQFGATGWTPAPPPPGGGPVFCLQPWCRIYLQVPVTTWRPIIFQIAARNVSEQQLPLPPGPPGPNPADIDPSGEFGTMSILTTRPTLEFAEDINGDGVVGIPDFNLWRARNGTVSPDTSGN